MAVKRFCMVLAAALVAAPAFGQALKDGSVLAGAKLRLALFGIEMSGYSPTFGFSWRECIQPNGDTMYYTPEGVIFTCPAKGNAIAAAQTSSTRACFIAPILTYDSPRPSVANRALGT